MPKERLVHIDVAKGIGILLVAFGHLVKFGSYTSNVIYSFHMPLFFVLSGVFADTQRKGTSYFFHKIKN